MATGVKAGEAFVEILANTTKFEKGIRRTERRLRKFSDNAIKIGKKLTTLFAGLAAPLAISSNNFASFESSLAKIGTLIDNDQVLIKRFSKEVKLLAVEFGESTDALASGLFDIISAGVDADKAITVLRQAVLLAKSGFTDTATSADALTTVLNAYNKEASDAAAVSDDLFTIAKLGKTDFAKLAPNIGKVATLASSAGVSFEELGASIATITRRGFSTEEAVTQVAAIITSFLKPTEQASKAAARFGIDLSAAGLASNGFAKSFAQLQGLDTEALAQIFPNVRAVKGVLGILDGFSGFTRDVDQLSTNAGAVQKAFEGISNILSIVFGRLKAIAAIITLEIGEALSKDLKALAKVLANVGDGIANFLSQNRQLIRAFAGTVALVGAAAAAFLTLGIAGKGLAFAFGGFATILKGAVAVLGVVPALIGFIVTKAGLLSVAIVGLGAVFVAQFDLIEKSIEFVKMRFLGLEKDFKKAFNGIKKAIGSGELEKAWEIAVLTMKITWARVVGELLTLWESFKAGVIDIITPIAEFVAQAFVAAFGAISAAWELVTNQFVIAWKSAVAGAELLLNGLRFGVESIFALFEDGDFSQNIQRVVNETLKRDEEIRTRAADDILTTDNKSSQRLKQIIEDTFSDIAVIAERGNLARQGASDAVDAQVSKARNDVKRLRSELDNILKAGSQDTVEAISPAIRRRRQQIENTLPKVPVTPGAVSASGAFNPFGIGRQTDKQFQQDLLNATKKNEKNTKDLLNEQKKNGGATFQ